MNIGNILPETPNQQEKEQEQQPIVQVQRLQEVDIDKQIQETTESEQQRINKPAIENNRILEKQKTLFGNLPFYNNLYC
jgi:hypothetical protein